MGTKESFVRLLTEYELANSWFRKFIIMPLPECVFEILATRHANKVEKKINKYLEFMIRKKGK